MTVVRPAYAKINLSLSVLGRREDGYHDILSVMQTVGLADRVTVAAEGSRTTAITLNASLPYVPRDEKNTAWKAAEVFLRYTGITAKADIFIGKHIPVGAGLAGGSADAAAVLLALDKIFDTRLPGNELIQIGKAVGADVPFCLTGGTARVEGIGERITRLPPSPGCHIVLCKPNRSIRTKDVFELFDKLKPETGKMPNDLEPVTTKLCGEVAGIKRELLAAGAKTASMTGSGPTVFGLFDDEKEAITTAEGLRQKYAETFLTKPYNP